jgi:drug/metabolite transporter (DMT)-like permease
MMTTRRATLLVLASACAYGTLSIVTSVTSQAGVALVALMAWRYALAAPALVIASGGPRTVLAATKGRMLALLLVGGGGQTLVTWLSLSSLEWISAASLGFLFYTYPAWVTVFAAIVGIERLSVARVGALALALTGITLMVGTPWTESLPLPGVLRALGAAMVYAAYVPLLHKMRGPLDAAVASTYVIIGAAIAFVTVASVQGVLFTGMTPLNWALAALLALFSTVFAFIAFLSGLAVLGPVRTAILSTLEPFWTALLGALLLSQPLGPATLAGGALIVAAILLLQRQGNPALPDAPLPD